jgi:hypothetical protein
MRFERTIKKCSTIRVSIGFLVKMELQRSKITAVVAGLTLLALPAHGETRICGAANVTVTYQQEEHAELACSAAQKATALFNDCNIPSFSNPVRVDVVDDLIADCLGVYHCGKNLIEVLSPAVMQDRGEPDGVFAHLSPDSYFQSVVVHELAHAATDGMPCPVKSCLAGVEYIAYAMQVMSLSPEEHLVFEENLEMDRLSSSDEINPIILLMAPDLFAEKVWAHFSQHDDSCGFIGQLVNGDFFFDNELYDEE